MVFFSHFHRSIYYHTQLFDNNSHLPFITHLHHHHPFLWVCIVVSSKVWSNKKENLFSFSLNKKRHSIFWYTTHTVWYGGCLSFELPKNMYTYINSTKIISRLLLALLFFRNIPNTYFIFTGSLFYARSLTPARIPEKKRRDAYGSSSVLSEWYIITSRANEIFFVRYVLLSTYK